MPQGTGKSTRGNGTISVIQGGKAKSDATPFGNGGMSATKPRNSNGSTHLGNGSTSHPPSEVYDFLAMREQKMDEKRRKTERTLFQYMLGVYSSIGEKKL
jgi:hypothetical protein